MRIQNLLPFGALFASTALLACGSTTTSSGPNGSVGGTSSNSSSSSTSSSSTSTSTNVGGSTSVGGSGQTSTTSNTSAGGNTAVGGTSAGQGGTNSTTTTGTKAVGGATAAGGTSSTKAAGGATGVGGTSGAAVGGNSSTGTKAVGGSTGVGGTSGGAVGGNSSTSTKATGGTTTAGGATTNGGTTANGGTSAVAGSSTAGGAGTAPKGYYYTADWGVTKVDWHGCAWTGIDIVSGTTTKITPQDFMAVTQGGPYKVTGTVNKAYEAVALLGFNIGEAIGTDPNQCKYDPTKTTEDGPPAATMSSIVTSTKGLAINWTAKTKPGMFRVQLQEPDCASNLGHCYCATVTDATGNSFVKWGDFAAYCWNADGSDTAHPLPVKYTNQAIDAVVFSAPGNGTADTAFDFTVVGFAPGDSAADAPGKAIGCGEQTGTLGNGGPSVDASMQRMAVTDANCKKYIVFNNNWGKPDTTSQTLDFVGNKFTVKTANGTNSGAPASFPAIYIGANGDTGGGTYDTWSDSGLPKKGSAITSANTTFTWTGNTGNYNAAYDIWFSDTSPAAGSYEDAIQGFIMVWLYKPDGQSPIGGSSKRSTGTIAGHKWDVWVGPRGNTSKGTKDSNRPVISYVAQDGPVKSLTFNIKDFINDAVTNATTDKNNGGTNPAFSADWYLTDVFAGFEAWTASAIIGNTATMSCVIQ